MKNDLRKMEDLGVRGPEGVFGVAVGRNAS